MMLPAPGRARAHGAPRRPQADRAARLAAHAHHRRARRGEAAQGDRPRGGGRAAPVRRHRAPEPPARAARARARVAARAPGARGRHAARARPVRCAALFALPLSSTLVLGLVFTRALTRVASIQGKYQAMVSETSALWAIDARIREAEAAREPQGGARRVALERGISFEGVPLERDGPHALRRPLARDPVGPDHRGDRRLGNRQDDAHRSGHGLVWPTAGRVSIDGVPLDELDLGAWRRQVGYVPQDLPMLHDSVRRNVTLGDPSLDDAAVEAALRLAGAWEFVSARCRVGSTRASANAARWSRAVSASASRSRARSCTSRAC